MALTERSVSPKEMFQLHMEFHSADTRQTLKDSPPKGWRADDAPLGINQ